MLVYPAGRFLRRKLRVKKSVAYPSSVLTSKKTGVSSVELRETLNFFTKGRGSTSGPSCVGSSWSRVQWAPAAPFAGLHINQAFKLDEFGISCR